MEKSRRWLLVSYAAEDEFKVIFKDCEEWAYIYHNADNATPHFHIYVKFKNARYLDGIRKQINSVQNTLGEIAKSTNTDIINYFMHKGIPDKHPYKFDDIRFSDNFKNSSNKVNDNEEFINDLLSDMSLRAMGIKYGRDFMKNYKSYYEFAKDLKREELFGSSYGSNQLSEVYFDYAKVTSKSFAYRDLENFQIPIDKI